MAPVESPAVWRTHPFTYHTRTRLGRTPLPSRRRIRLARHGWRQTRAVRIFAAGMAADISTNSTMAVRTQQGGGRASFVPARSCRTLDHRGIELSDAGWPGH